MCIATDLFYMRWITTHYHVLCNPSSGMHNTIYTNWLSVLHSTKTTEPIFINIHPSLVTLCIKMSKESAQRSLRCVIPKIIRISFFCTLQHQINWFKSNLAPLNLYQIYSTSTLAAVNCWSSLSKYYNSERLMMIMFYPLAIGNCRSSLPEQYKKISNSVAALLFSIGCYGWWLLWQLYKWKG